MPAMTTLFTTALSLLHLASAHLIMDYPVPMGLDSLNNSPLVDAKPGTSQSDFPCKQRTGVYDITVMNHFSTATPIELNFTGSASHGGGTCQVAITMDTKPTASSVWKIIQVYEGGCPTSGDGNDGTHPFTFEIPAGFPNGKATLSWSWYNRIGNREFYMNCAAITVAGGADDDKGKTYFESLPDLYVINLPTSECSSVESSCQKIPNPGQFILRANDDGKIAAATGPSCAASAAAQTKGVQGYKTAVSSDGAATQAPAAGGSGGAAASHAADGAYSAESSAPATTSAAIATSAPPTYATLSPSSGDGVAGPATGSAVPTGSSASSYSAPDSNSGSASGTGEGEGTCTSEGAVVCKGSTHFGLCNHGVVVWQAVAEGTECAGGVVSKVKRDDGDGSSGNATAKAHAEGMGMMHEKMAAEAKAAHEEGMTMGKEAMHSNMTDGEAKAHQEGMAMGRQEMHAKMQGHARRHLHGRRGRSGWRELSVEEAVEGMEG